MLNTVNSNRNDCFNLEFGFKKLMHIIYTQAPVHPCTLWAKKRKYDSGKKAQTDRQTVKYYLKQTLGLNKFTLIFWYSNTDVAGIYLGYGRGGEPKCFVFLPFSSTWSVKIQRQYSISVKK